MIKAILLLSCVIFAGFAWKVRRDPGNWYLDTDTKLPVFGAWPQLGLLMAGLATSAILAYLILLT